MQIGIYTFAETTPDPKTGRTVSAARRLRDLIEEMELADQAGLDVFGVGEHHRPDFAVSAPAVVLAAGAERTKRIRLTSAVTVLSSDDPVRVFQDFATLDLLSGGRAEIMAGRGSFIESFPLFGYDLDDYDELFAQKLNLLGLPMALAIIGGTPARFAPFVELYRDTARRTGHDLTRLSVSINSHAYIADTSQQAAEEFFPSYAEVMTRIGRERGWAGMTRQQFDVLRSPHGALLVGSPQEVVEKILFQHEIFGHQRFLAQLTVGSMPHDKTMHAIELLGTKVAPVVRKEIAHRTATSASTARSA
jgi:alkanesulfonate monooxygenase SsuD/methylene tetrahydromethanopterin reductase-like flavin-dependent oxidoreductase (luciferase family)